MNGRKARALRKRAAQTAKTMVTSYTQMPRLGGRKCPVFLNDECHRAVYQQLKKA